MAATDYDFLASRSEIIERAMRIVGALEPGGTLSGDMSVQAQLVLNSVVKSWQTEGLLLWSLKTTTQALTASTSSYSLSTDPAVVALDSAYLRISNEDQPLEVISFRQYQDIPKKSESGEPTHVAIDNNRSPTLYVWPVPTTSYTMYYSAITKLKDWDSESSTGDIPVHFQEALTFALAAALSYEYSLPIGEKNSLEAKAERLFQKAKSTNIDRSDAPCVESAYPNRRR